MIPKVIHYCWFGRRELPDHYRKYIESWKKFCPDYNIIEWNEENFDIQSNLYVKEAYESKKYAFVSDYVRLYALYNYGGIYMDTDVEVIRNLDEFLNENSFFGFENNNYVTTGIIGSISNQKVFEDLLLYYKDRSFINRRDGSFDLTTNVSIITKYFENNGLVLNNKKQKINGVTLYPSDYFCPKDFETGKIIKTTNTYTIHHFSGSWLSNLDKFKRTIIKHIGLENCKKIKKIILRKK